MPEVILESEEWYVLGNWLRERENRLMYALRPKSDEWEFVHDLRRTIEREQQQQSAETTETAGTPDAVPLSDRQMTYLSSFLQRRARKLLLFPWRSRERRDVRHLRAHLLDEAKRSGDATARSAAPGQRRG